MHSPAGSVSERRIVRSAARRGGFAGELGLFVRAASAQRELLWSATYDVFPWLQLGLDDLSRSVQTVVTTSSRDLTLAADSHSIV